MNYDEWFKSLNQNGRETYFLGQEGTISKESWNYQQAKIDELQARIDEALKELELITCYRTGNSDNAIDILKGNKDETGLN